MAGRWACIAVALLSSFRAQETLTSVDEPQDAWALLTKPEWQPGKVGEFKTSVPMKDLECEGPQTAIVGDAAVSWAMIKERLHRNLKDPFNDVWLLEATMNVQRFEPDSCVLGVTITSAYLLPVTMPKFRNMARTLNVDCNFLVLNVTFYETLRSGFPVFGVLDGLATEEYRAWFSSEEGRSFFPEEECEGSFQEEVHAARLAGRAVPLPLALKVISEKPACPLAVAAAYLAYALALTNAKRKSRAALLRDVIELVSHAEELIRAQGEKLRFGRLVASDWNVWWLLHRLQLALPGVLAPWPAWRRPQDEGLVAA